MTNEKSKAALVAELEMAYQARLDCLTGETLDDQVEAQQKLDEARAAVLARMAGPGEVVVPREPTEEMIEVAQDAVCECYTNDEGDNELLCTPADAWRVMVEVAARPNQGGNDGASK